MQDSYEDIGQPFIGTTTDYVKFNSQYLNSQNLGGILIIVRLYINESDPQKTEYLIKSVLISPEPSLKF